MLVKSLFCPRAAFERIDHIPVVDDDRDIRELIVDYLEKSGYRASGAANGKAMWSVLKNHQIDLIVLDIMMPGEDGLTSVASCAPTRSRISRC